MPKCDKITFVVGRNVTHNLLLYKKIGFLLKNPFFVIVFLMTQNVKKSHFIVDFRIK